MNEPRSSGWPREAADAAGTVLGGRYEVRREIARGGMATVYLAEDTLLNRPVAVKVLTGDASAGERDEFLREARAVAKLSHPNIVEVYDAGIEGSLRFIVMQYVPGGSLRDVLSREAPLDPRRAVILTIRLADALNFGHRRGIVHCDVKPGNVLLGEDGAPKIVDFGIARSLTGTGDLSDLIVGTVGYISPEQVEGQPVDGRADVYSLAAVLYEMLIGAPPFQGQNLATVAAQRLVTPPVPPHQRNPAVPEAVSQVVMQGLTRDPNDRFATAKAFGDALRAAVSADTETVTRRMPSQAEMVTRRVAGTAGGVTEALPPGQRAAVHPAETVATRPASRAWAFWVIAGLLSAALVALIIVVATTLGDRGSDRPIVSVPAVTGVRIDEAAPQLHEAGLIINVETVTNAAPFGTVIAQDPPAGQTVRSGDAVNLVVSVGNSPP
jgi:serine/threonine-protein kinase